MSLQTGSRKQPREPHVFHHHAAIGGDVVARVPSKGESACDGFCFTNWESDFRPPCSLSRHVLESGIELSGTRAPSTLVSRVVVSAVNLERCVCE
jgi:hypothetical protein